MHKQLLKSLLTLLLITTTTGSIANGDSWFSTTQTAASNTAYAGRICLYCATVLPTNYLLLVPTGLGNYLLEKARCAASELYKRNLTLASKETLKCTVPLVALLLLNYKIKELIL